MDVSPSNFLAPSPYQAVSLQPVATVNREYHCWFSPRLNREMSLLVFGHAGARVLVFPTRSGHFYDYENWGLVQSLQVHLQHGWLQLFCVDSFDAESLYCWWRQPQERIAQHVRYEAYILEEVLPFTHMKNSHPCLMVHGCSMGAYHAVNLALRQPHLFKKVVALSGRYDLTMPMGSFRDLFDGYYDDTIYYHTPSHFVRNLHHPDLLDHIRRLEITFVIGQEDAFLENNRHFSQILWDKGIEHVFHIWQGEAHKPREWREMVGLYL